MSANPTFDAVLHATTPLNAKPREPELKWHEDDDLPFGWSMTYGYTIEFEDGDAQAWIHRAILNTGQREIELALNEIDAKQLRAAEELIADGEWLAAQDAAEARAYDADDHGDWLYEARKDKQS